MVFQLCPGTLEFSSSTFLVIFSRLLVNSSVLLDGLVKFVTSLVFMTVLIGWIYSFSFAHRLD